MANVQLHLPGLDRQCRHEQQQRRSKLGTKLLVQRCPNFMVDTRMDAPFGAAAHLAPARYASVTAGEQAGYLAVDVGFRCSAANGGRCDLLRQHVRDANWTQTSTECFGNGTTVSMTVGLQCHWFGGTGPVNTGAKHARAYGWVSVARRHVA